MRECNKLVHGPLLVASVHIEQPQSDIVWVVGSLCADESAVQPQGLCTINMPVLIFFEQ